jgi:hypothetical protein
MKIEIQEKKPLLFFRIFFLIIILMLSRPASSPAVESYVTQEYKVKAAFVYNFSLFVDWPPGAYNGPNSPFVICILGKHAFGNTFDNLAGKMVKKRVLKIQYATDIKNIGNCQILYICMSERMRLAEIIAATERRSILTISDMPGFNRAGGMINLVNVEDKIRFDINMKAAKQSGLSLNFQLLNMAHDVTN